jgi:general secretion pathway protein H
MLISTPNKETGFTLVELMVVLFLIGLAAGAVILTVSGSTRSSASQAEEFAARIAALRDRSVIEGRPLAYWVRASGYGFERREGTKWRSLDTKPFATVNWQQPAQANIPGGRMLRVAFDGSGVPSAPMDVVISGGATPLRVTMDSAGSVDVVR